MVLEPQTVQSSSLPPWFITGVISYFPPQLAELSIISVGEVEVQRCDQTVTCQMSGWPGASSEATIIPSVSINHSGSISRLSQQSLCSFSLSLPMQTVVAPGPQVIGGGVQNTWLVWTTASCMTRATPVTCCSLPAFFSFQITPILHRCNLK